MNLYELKENYKQLTEFLYLEETEDKEILEILNNIEEEIEYKADSYAKIIRNIEEDVDKIKREKARLEARQEVLEAKVKLLKDNLFSMMKETGKTKFNTALFNFNICKNGGKLPIEYAENINILELEERFTKKELNKDEVRIALEDGEYVEFAKLLERGDHLRIK